MKKYQKLLALLLALAMMAALAGCGSSGNDSQSASGSESTASASAEGDTSEDVETVLTSGEPVYGSNLNCYHNSDIDAYFDPAIGDTVCWNLFLEGLWSYDETSSFAMNSDNLPREREYPFVGNLNGFRSTRCGPRWSSGP